MSVLLPVRDAGSALSACLDSLAAQSLADHELIAVDDGSCDGSGERLAERAALDPRLRLLRTPPRGIAAALNPALRALGGYRGFDGPEDYDLWRDGRALASRLAIIV